MAPHVKGTFISTKWYYLHLFKISLEMISWKINQLLDFLQLAMLCPVPPDFFGDAYIVLWLTLDSNHGYKTNIVMQ